MPRSRPLKLFQFVADLIEVGETTLATEAGMDAQQARSIMLKMAREFCFRNAKSDVYIPEAAGLANLERDAGIWADYQRDNPEPPFTRKFTPERAYELAALHGLSPQRIWAIVRGQRESELADRQADLPGLS